MSTTNTNTNTQPKNRPANFHKDEWDTMTFDAYRGIVALVEGKTTGAKFLNHHAQLFKRCGVPSDGIHLLRLVTFMSNYCTVKGDKVLKVKAVSTIRKYFNGEWASLDARQVVYDTKTKDPRTAAKKNTNSKKGPTKADLEAQNAELIKQLEALKSLLPKAA